MKVIEGAKSMIEPKVNPEAHVPRVPLRECLRLFNPAYNSELPSTSGYRGSVAAFRIF